MKEGGKEGRNIKEKYIYYRLNIYPDVMNFCAWL